MDLFEMQVIDRGRGFAVGFALGELQTKWRIARAMGEPGQHFTADDPMLSVLGMDLPSFTSARDLGQTEGTDLHASSELRRIVHSILDRGYGDIYAQSTVEIMAERYFNIAKAQIITTRKIGYQAEIQAFENNSLYLYDEELNYENDEE